MNTAEVKTEESSVEKRKIKVSEETGHLMNSLKSIRQRKITNK